MVEIVLIAYGVLVAAGGIFGHVKSQSRPSLIAGSVSGLPLIAAGLLVLMGVAAGAYLGFAVNVLLVVLFGMRFGKTRKFMPSGMMLALSVVVAGVLVSMLFM